MAKVMRFHSGDEHGIHRVVSNIGHRCVNAIDRLRDEAREHEMHRLKEYLADYPIDEWQQVLALGLFEVEDSELGYLRGKLVFDDIAYLRSSEHVTPILARINVFIEHSCDRNQIKIPELLYDFNEHGRVIVKFQD